MAGVVGPVGTAAAAPALSIEPLTWNVIGLDSNDVTTGPNRYLTGARVCNTGDAVAEDVTATLVWTTANDLIQLVGPASVPLGSVAPGACVDAYFLVEVTRDPAAYDTSRGYRIEASAAGVPAVSTPSPRELVVERLISQSRNQALTVTGPTEVWVGQTVTYDVTASTATNGYEQLQNFLPFPHAIFRIVSIHQTYSAPTGATNDRPYADACGWDHDPTSPTYRTCVGPGSFAGGRAGGALTTRYTLEVVAPGTATVADVIYDYSGSSYHYNADYGDPSLTIVARVPTDLELAKVASQASPRVGDPFTYTLTLTNTSGVDATGVVVTDTASEGLRLLEASTVSGTLDVATGVWDVGTVGAGDTVTATVTAVADTTGELTNTAEVTAADQPDADSTPDNGVPTEDDHAIVTVRPGTPALTIDKQASATTAVAGDTLRYRVVVTNTGSHLASDVTITDPLPDGTTYVAGSTTLDGVPVSDVAGRSPLVAGLPVGDLAPGASALVTYAVTVTGAVSPVDNVATATTPGVPPVTATTSTPVGSATPGEPAPPDEQAARELPATGLDAGQRTSWAWALAAVLAGWLLVALAHDLDRRQRIRAINVGHRELLRAQRTGELWQDRDPSTR